MNVYKEMVEIQELKDLTNNQRNNILDQYFKDPEKAKALMLETLEIEKELNEIEEELKKIQNEIY